MNLQTDHSSGFRLSRQWLPGRRAALTVAVALLCVTARAASQDLSHYRDFKLGADVATVSATADVAAATAKAIHERPARLDDLEWRPTRWPAGTTIASTDPVEQIRFSFYNDQLFRMVVDYAHDRTEGMTDADLVAALTTQYGSPVPRAKWRSAVTASPIELESGSRLARWDDGSHAVVLYRTPTYRATYRVIVTDTALGGLARKAEADAVRLDEIEAPQRDLAKARKDRDSAKAAAEKARTENKETFRP